MNKVAITYTIKNEADLILQNINFHKKLGVEHFWVFLDNSSDNSLELLKKQDNVSTRESVRPEELADSLIDDKFLAKRDNHDARRVYNSSWAAREAKARGFDWLICIDADELILCDFDNFEKAQINLKLAEIDKDISQVVFKTYEQVPSFKQAGEAFNKEDSFLDSDKLKQERTLYDPFEKTNIRIERKFLGHDAGKVAFRLSELDSYYPLTHRWLNREDNKPGDLIIIDSLLHYYFYSIKNFQQRFINYQNRSKLSIANFEYPKHILKLIEFAQRMNDIEFKEYCEKYISNQDQLKTFDSEGIIKPEVLKRLF